MEWKCSMDVKGSLWNIDTNKETYFFKSVGYKLCSRDSKFHCDHFRTSRVSVHYPESRYSEEAHIHQHYCQQQDRPTLPQGSSNTRSCISKVM